MARSLSTDSLPLESDRAANVVLWAGVAASSLLVGGYFLVRVYRHVDVDSALALVELLGRTAVFTTSGLALEGLLLHLGVPGRELGKARWVALHVLWTGATLLCVCLLVDLVVFFFAGYHLLTGARILLSGGPRELGKTVEAVGVSPWLVAASVLAAAAVVGAAVHLSRWTGRVSARARLVVGHRTAFQTLLVAIAAIGVLETISYNVRNPWLWEREIRSVPLAFSIVRPEAEVASFRVALHRPPSARERAAAVTVGPVEEKPDVIVFVLESLRKDVVTPENMPRLSAFAAGAWTFEHPITTGNVTQYSWYGLFCAEPPIFFEAAKASPAEHGSVPLAVLRRLGYRIQLFATPNRSTRTSRTSSSATGSRCSTASSTRTRLRWRSATGRWWRRSPGPWPHAPGWRTCSWWRWTARTSTTPGEPSSSRPTSRSPPPLRSRATRSTP